jgi:hypothetical protein
LKRQVCVLDREAAASGVGPASKPHGLAAHSNLTVAVAGVNPDGGTVLIR